MGGEDRGKGESPASALREYEGLSFLVLGNRYSAPQCIFFSYRYLKDFLPCLKIFKTLSFSLPCFLREQTLMQLSKISSKPQSHVSQRNQNSLLVLLMEILLSVNKEETELSSIFAR